MKQTILLCIMVLSLFPLTAFSENEFDSVFLNLKNYTSSEKKEGIETLNSFVPQNKNSAFKKHYLLSMFYYSFEREQMQHVIENLEESELILKDISSGLEDLSNFLLELNGYYSEIIMFQEFTFSDFEEIVDLMLKQFETRINICTLLNAPGVALQIKGELISFENIILSENVNCRDQISVLIDKLDNIMKSKVSISNITKE